MNTASLDTHTVASVLETIAFIVATILAIIHDPHFAEISFGSGAAFHAYNH